MPGVVRRRTGLSDPHPLLGFDGDSAFKESGVLLASAATLGGANEVQTVTITGTPTGGNFTLTYDGATTAGIAFNANAAAVQSALEALTNIGTGNVAVGGGPGPGTPYTVTFQNTLGKRNVSQMTAAHTFTGGTTPAIAVTTTTAGSSIDSTVYKAKRGLILMKGGSGNSKLVAWDGASAATVVGVLQDTVVLLQTVVGVAPTSPENDTPVAYYAGPGLTFNAGVLAQVQPSVYTGGGITNFLTWAQQNGNRVATQGTS